MTDINAVVEKIKADEALKKQFAAAVKEKKAVEFLKGIGVEVTEEEIQEYFKSRKKEVALSELDDAAGGGCSNDDVLISVVFLGSACAAMSIINAVEGDSSCVTK